MSSNKTAQFICIVSMLVIIVGFVVPMVATAILVGKSSTMMDRIAGSMDRELGRYDDNIAAGGDRQQLVQLHQALQDSSALPGEAARGTSKLHVGLVSFYEPNGLADKQSARQTFFPATMNVGGLHGSAAIVIASGPVAWTLSGVRPAQRGRLALEGRAPVMIKDPPQGFLAGLRIKGFGAYRTASVKSLDDDRRGFCRSIRDWGGFFDVASEDIIVWRVELPTDAAEMRADDNGFGSASGSISEVDTLAHLCRR